MEDLVGSMGKALIENAMRRVIIGFEFPISEEDGIGVMARLELAKYAKQNPVTLPCGIIIKANTRIHPRSAVGLLSVIVRELANSGLVDQDRIRQFHFDRLASNEETVEVYIIALED